MGCEPHYIKPHGGGRRNDDEMGGRPHLIFHPLSTAFIRLFRTKRNMPNLVSSLQVEGEKGGLQHVYILGIVGRFSLAIYRY